MSVALHFHGRPMRNRLTCKFLVTGIFARRGILSGINNGANCPRQKIANPSLRTTAAHISCHKYSLTEPAATATRPAVPQAFAGLSPEQRPRLLRYLRISRPESS